MAPTLNIGLSLPRISIIGRAGGGGGGTPVTPPPPPAPTFRTVATWDALTPIQGIQPREQLQWLIGNQPLGLGGARTATTALTQGFAGLPTAGTFGRWNWDNGGSTGSSNTGPSPFNTRPFVFYETSSNGHNFSRFRSCVGLVPTSRQDPSSQGLPDGLIDLAEAIDAWMMNHSVHREVDFFYNASGGGFYNDDHGLLFYTASNSRNLVIAVNSSRRHANLDNSRSQAFGFVYPGNNFVGGAGTFVNLYQPNAANFNTDYNDGQTYPHNETEAEVALPGPWIKHTFRIPFTHTSMALGIDVEGARALSAASFVSDVCITRIVFREETT